MRPDDSVQLFAGERDVRLDFKRTPEVVHGLPHPALAGHQGSDEEVGPGGFGQDLRTKGPNGANAYQPRVPTPGLPETRPSSL